MLKYKNVMACGDSVNNDDWLTDFSEMIQETVYRSARDGWQRTAPNTPHYHLVAENPQTDENSCVAFACS